MEQELWKMGAGQLADAIAQREILSVDVVSAHLDRIEAINSRLNAVVQTMRSEALAAAEAADRATSAGVALGPLHGVPVSIKCNIDMKGAPSTWGVPALSRAVASMDSPLIERLRAAGAIPIARTNCPDMAMRVHTDSSLYGLTRNPWSYHHTAAGSSGGEAAAIASGMSPLGFGNDIGGSLRSPASACGIASIKPTTGLVPDASQPPFDSRPIAFQLMASHGPLGRTVADVRLGLQAISGAHPLDPLSLSAWHEKPARSKLRVALVSAPPGGACAPEIKEATVAAATALERSGYEVVEQVPPQYEEVLVAWGELLMGDYSALWPQMSPLMGDAARDFFDNLFSLYPRLESSQAMSALLIKRDRLARAWAEFMHEYPLVLSPTWTELPFVNGFDVSSSSAVARTVEMIRPVLPANLLGLPSACVPAARAPGIGLPIGVLITGRRFRDDECLAAAEIIEGTLLAVNTPVEPSWIGQEGEELVFDH